MDYARYLARAADEFALCRATAYGAQINNEARGFLTVLRGLGFETKYRQAIHSDIRGTDRNIILAMDVWRSQVDVVILGSNDPDLAPLIERVKELGIQVVLFACDVSRELRFLVDRTIEFDDTLTHGVSRKLA